MIVRQYGYANTLESATPIQDIIDNKDNEFFDKTPSCPSGGTYSIEGSSASGYKLTCSYHGTQLLFTPASALSFYYGFASYDSYDDLLSENVSVYGDNSEWFLNDDGNLQNKASSENRIFFDIPYDTYSIKTKATLSTETTAWGYGIFFESVLGNDVKDTGYIMQFDKKFKSILFRERNNGNEKDPFLEIDPSQIIDSLSNDWWYAPHEIELVISEGESEDEKTFELYIDGKSFTEDVDAKDKTIDSSGDELSHAGYRSWNKSSSEFEYLEITE